MSKELATTLNLRMKAGALVVIVQEADEQLAVAAVEAGAAPHGQVRVVSSSDAEALSMLEAHTENSGVLVIPDLLAIYGENPLTVRMIREVALQVRDPGDAYSRLVLVEAPTTKIPDALLSDCEVITVDLPTVASLTEELIDFAEGAGCKLGDDEETYRLAGAVAGLARHEARRLFATCYLENERKLDASWLRRAKALKVSEKLDGALTFESELSADVGGLDNLKEWLRARQAAFVSAKAREFGLPEPKGMLLLGVPGCGKSLSAKTTAREWGVPLLRLDIGKAMGSLVGQSEAQTRAAIAAAEAAAPCVLWVDEIEKGLAGAGSGSTDGGTTQRVFGTLLTWLQEKTSPVFVVATANKISGLPPELLRKGRFDEIFFVDLPAYSERVAIAEIHVTRRGAACADLVDQVGAIAEATNGFSGAEIEQAVIESMFTAFSAKRRVKIEDVLQAIQATAPISKTMVNEITELRKWADGRARNATPTDLKPTPKAGRRRRGPNLN